MVLGNGRLILFSIVVAFLFGIPIGATIYDIYNDTSVDIMDSSLDETQLVISGNVFIDGSSTVYPITEYIASLFMDRYPTVNVYVGISGTGGGFKRFIMGEIDINDASRPIKDDEAREAYANGVDYTVIPIAIDGVAVVVNKDNDWVDYLTIEELRRIWMPNSKIERWSDIRPEWPDEPIKLYGPGPDSGTFDFFTEYVVGEAGASRIDYVASEDDNFIVQGVVNDKYALGYFGYAYYIENRDRVRAIAIHDGSQSIEPTEDNIISFRYPLSRLLYLYVNVDSLESKPQVKEFLLFYLRYAYNASLYVGYVPLPRLYYDAVSALIDSGVYVGYVELALEWVPKVLSTYDR